MAKIYGSTFAAAKAGTLPQVSPDGRLVGAKQRRTMERFTLAAQPVADKLFLGTLPAGACFAGVRFTSSVSLGAATLSVGSEANPTKYRDAGTFTAVDVPTLAGKASAIGQSPLDGPEDVYATVAAAALPGAGTFTTELFFTTSA